MESISIVSVLMDNYVYNVNNFGVDVANEQLSKDVDYHEAEAMEASAGRAAQRAYLDGSAARTLDDEADETRSNAYSKKDLEIANSLNAEAKRIREKHLGTYRALTHYAGYNGPRSASQKKELAHVAKAGATTGVIRERANKAEKEGLLRKASRYRSVADAIERKHSHGSASNVADAARAQKVFDTAKEYGSSRNLRESKDSAILDDICYNLMHDIYSIGMESALSQLDRTLDSVDIPELEEMAMEAISDAPTYNGNAVLVGGYNTPGN